MTGRLLSNRYLIGERIGIGGMAEVYQGQDNVLGRTVAVKVMLPQYAEDAAFTARFRQEAAAAANLQSPYIVNVYDWGQEADTSFIIMEFVRGSDLKTAIQQRGAINQRKVAEIGSQVCQALAVAHGLDIIHRDIKPQNIMVQPDGNVKVMDFGIARAKNSVMAKTDAVLGTAHYISPEQAQGKDLTATSDIYSLGVVMYEAATGKLPFDGPDSVSVALKQVQEAPVPPREINPAIDPALEAIILKAMAKNPQDRFATARDMRHALNDFIAGRKVSFAGFNSAETAFLPENIAPMPYNAEQTAVMTPSIDGTGPVRVRAVNDPDANKKNGRGKRVALILLGVIVAIAAIAGISYALLGQGVGNNADVEVPDVTNMKLDQATSKLQEAGLEVGSIDYVYNDKAEADTVLGQTPRAGSTQPKETKISLTVSQGIEQVEVPDLTDMTANEARAALQRANLKYETGAAEHSETVKENRVMRQSPAAGTKVDKNSTVTYILSAGPETIEIPNVVGMLEGEATATLNNAGLLVAYDYQPDANVPQGAIVSQSPAAGEHAKENATVSLVVSTGVQYFNASSYSTNPAGGTVTPEYTSVPSGGSVSFYITPNAGYQISSVVDSNGTSYGTSNAVTIGNVRGDISLSVSFEEVAPQPTPGPSGGSTSGSSASGGSSNKNSGN